MSRRGRYAPNNRLHRLPDALVTGSSKVGPPGVVYLESGLHSRREGTLMEAWARVGNFCCHRSASLFLMGLAHPSQSRIFVSPSGINAHWLLLMMSIDPERLYLVNGYSRVPIPFKQEYMLPSRQINWLHFGLPLLTHPNPGLCSTHVCAICNG